MNLPNKLTVLRMALIPVFMVFALIDGIPHHYLWAFLIFMAASFTDMLDGRIARKYNLITDFGKLMDPLADKLLVMSALVCFVELYWTPAAVVILILAREFLVTSLRLIAAGSGKVLAADKWGKYKTVSQMFWICYLFLAKWAAACGFLPWEGALYGIHIVMMCLVTILTLASGLHYVWVNRELIASK